MTGALLSSDETHNTLKFANRAKRMKNHAAINEVSNEKVGRARSSDAGNNCKDEFSWGPVDFRFGVAAGRRCLGSGESAWCEVLSLALLLGWFVGVIARGHPVNVVAPGPQILI